MGSQARRPRRAVRRGIAASAVTLASLLLTASTFARPLEILADQPVTSLRAAVEILEDPAGRLRIEEITAPPVADRFRALPPGQGMSFGNTRSAYWFRFQLVNGEPEAVDLLLEVGYPLLDRIEFHAPGRAVVVLGDTLPFMERPILLRSFALPLTVPARAAATYHLRIETAGIFNAPLEIGSPARMLEKEHREQLILGLLYGIFLGALLYNLFLWLSIRDVVNLYLVAHILSVCLGLATIDGLAFQIWPTATGWQQWAAHLTAPLVSASTLLFVRRLVNSREHTPRLDRLLRLALWAMLVTCLLAAPWGARVFLLTAISWLMIIGVLLGATVLWHAARGHWPSRIYSLAWVVFLLVMSATGASIVGILPNFPDLLLVARLAAAGEVLLAAIAVAANLREARNALASSEAKFARAFHSSPDALTLSSLEDGRFLEVNDAFEKISGFNRAEAVGRTSVELGIWSAETRRRFVDELRRSGSIRQRENVIVGKGGHEIPVRISGELIEIEGRPVLLATTRDITEQRRANEQRESLIRELEAKNTELERFSYTASHDLRSPLVTVLGFLGILEKDMQIGDRQQFKKDVGRIRSAAEHMRQLLDELLELSRIGRVLQPPQRVPLTAVAEEAAAIHRKTLDELGIQLTITPDLPVVRGDRTRLLQVVQNLLDNAIRFLGEQPEPRIEIGWRRDGDDRVCLVRDNGIGIDPRHHDSIFELFRRLRPGVDGTGVGLTLVRRIVEGHGGRVWVESAGLGTGSTFCFVIPDTSD